MGPNWEEILGSKFEKRSKDYNFKTIEKDLYEAQLKIFLDPDDKAVQTQAKKRWCTQLD